MITLYELAGKNDLRFSPPCWNVKLCLLYKNIDFETVYHHANDADFWRIIGYYANDGFSYDKLAMENELYQNFDAFNNKNVVFCDSKSTSYFERGALEPHVILLRFILLGYQLQKIMAVLKELPTLS